MVWRWLVTMSLVIAGGCAAGAPLGFEKGTNNWSIPLEGTLANGVPLAQVEIDGKGPYLFAINLDMLSTIDPALAQELGLWETRTTKDKAVDEQDDVVIEQFTYAELPRFTVGNLTVSNRRFIAMRPGASYEGQPILGIIGRDVISETLIWTLDRDRAMLHIATQGHYTPPPEAQQIELSLYQGQIFVKAKIEDRITAELRVRFHNASQLWPELAAKAGLERVDTGDQQNPPLWLAKSVQIGRVYATDVPFFAFQDERVREVEYDGVLGQDLWSRYRITVNVHKRVMWLEPRSRELGRMGR